MRKMSKFEFKVMCAAMMAWFTEARAHDSETVNWWLCGYIVGLVGPDADMDEMNGLIDAALSTYEDKADVDAAWATFEAGAMRNVRNIRR